MVDKDTIGINTVVTTSVYVLTFIFIGLPLWWKTTTVYRYPIPHSECQNLLSEKVKHTIFTKIVLEDNEVQQGFFWEELLKIMNEEQRKDTIQPTVDFQWSMSVASKEEEILIQKYQSISELDNAFQLHEENKNHPKRYTGELTIVVLSKNFTSGQKFTIGNGRYGYILNDGDCKTLAEGVVFLAKKISQVERLQKLYTPASLYSGDKTPDKDRMRYLRASKSFDITFSLIVPEPQVLDVHWNIENAINEYWNSILGQLNMISSVKVKSQVLYMTTLPIPTQLSINDKKEYILQSEHLPSLINPVEDKLGSDTSVHPNLNFILYIPSRKQTPLRIYDSEGQPLPLNAFLLPQWGGFMMYNYILSENASLPQVINLNMQTVMEIFLAQFRLLLGLPDIGSLSSESILELKGPIIRKWEMDFLLRKNAQEQLSSSMSSLSSLSHLLQKIRNIVIRDDIGEKIHFALMSTKESLKLLSEGHLEEGFKKAQSAFVASDEAFFDPSLLALLYFPEDQKYAIYIPLFLPISIPVITSVAQLWKYWQNRKKLKTD